MRILTVNDYFPDLELMLPDGGTSSTAALCRQPALLMVSQHATETPRQLQDLKDVQPDLTILHVICHSAELQHNGIRVGNQQASAVLFESPEQRARFFLLREDGKILRASTELPDVDTLTLQISGRYSPESLPRPPLLVVDRVLPIEFCHRLIEDFERDPAPIQGRVGLSSPTYNPALKRVDHINLGPELSHEVDSCLIFSLIPMIERSFGYRVTRRVAYKVSRYDSRQAGYFYPHRDNSDAGTLFRRYALSIALNDNWQGGDLVFPEFGADLHRVGTGSAMVFPTPLLHTIRPVTRGCRYVLLTFLYDEAGAMLRRQASKTPEIIDQKYPDLISEPLNRIYREHYASGNRGEVQYVIDDLSTYAINGTLEKCGRT